MKPCSQVLAYGPNFHGKVLPLYALYGSVNNKLYFCSKLFPNEDHFYTIFIWNGYHWVKDSTKNHGDIRHFMASYMHHPSFIRKKCVSCLRLKHKAEEKIERKEKEYAKFFLATAPWDKKIPKPQCDKFSGCYSQSMVDGKGYNISLEEYYEELHNYSGLPAKDFELNKPFDGVGSNRKDGMKIDQTKIRPEKSSSQEKPKRAKRISITGQVTVIDLA